MDSPTDARRLVLPAGMNREVGLLFAALEQTRSRTRSLLQGLAAGELDRRPDPKRPSIGALALHVAWYELVWVRQALLEQAIEPPLLRAYAAGDLRGGAHLELAGHDASFYLDKLDYVRAQTESACWSLDERSLQRPRSDPFGGEPVDPLWILAHLADHEAHHRGQIALLRRTAGTARP